MSGRSHILYVPALDLLDTPGMTKSKAHRLLLGPSQAGRECAARRSENDSILDRILDSTSWPRLRGLYGNNPTGPYWCVVQCFCM